MSNPKYCELKRQVWFATLKIPKELHYIFNKTKFSQTTETSDRKLAGERAMVLAGKWKQYIRDARLNKLDDPAHPYHIEEMQRQIDNAQTDEEHESIIDGIDAVAEHLLDKGLEDQARTYFKLSSGKLMLLNQYKDDWVRENLALIAPKSRTQKISDIKWLFKQFVDIDSISRQSVTEWLRKLIRSKAENGFGFSASATSRILSAARDYWGYVIERLPAAQLDEKVFATPNFLLKLKAGDKKTDRTAFTASECLNLLEAANLKADIQLAQAIEIAMYTGARREELCSLKAQDCTTSWLKIEDAKTDAGNRMVPVHPALKPLIAQLIQNTTDGYLIPNLPVTKHGDRSDALGKRFGRLKKKLKFGSDKVFHSFRRTVVTQLHEAGILEDVMAAIVGHENGGFTKKTYSDANFDKKKLAAIKKLKY